MKKVLIVLLSLLLVGSILVGCSSGTVSGPDTGDGSAGGQQNEAAEDQDSQKSGTYEDGVYYAQEDEYAGSGYRYFVVLNVEGGEITDAHWGGTNIQPVGNKYTLAQNGDYGMSKVAAAGEWDVQADAAIKHLIETQDPTDINYTTDDGHTEDLQTDDGATVSIHVVEFFDLAEKALAAGPVEKGDYDTPEDYVSTAVLDGGDWEYRLDLVIVNGRIMDSNMNAVFAGEFNDDNAQYFSEGDDPQPLSKKELGMDYGMDWEGNADNVDAFVEETQGFEIEYNDDEGHTDTISGVSIHVNEYEDMFKEATGK